MGMKLTDDELQLIREVSIHRILSVSNQGRKIPLRCPFHNERTPSFYLYPDNSYHCYGCGAHGNNALDFALGFNRGFAEALDFLADYI